MGFVATILGHLSPDATSDCLIEVRRDDGLVPFSRADVGALVARARGQLRGVITPGDRVGIIAPNSVHWVASDLAIIAEGGISVPLYYRQAPADLCGMLTDASPTLLLVESETLAESVRSAWSGHSAEACEIRVLADVFEQGGIEIREAPRALQPSDPVTIIYTSGTSGAAKGAVYSASNIDFMLPTTGRALAALCNNETEAQRVFHYLPFCFAGSRIMLWTQLLRPNPLMISTDLTALVDELQLAKPNYYLNVPTVLERIRRGVDDVLNERGGIALSLYRNALEADQRIRSGRGSIKDRVLLKTARNVVFPRIKETIGPNLRFLICGSAPLSAETQQWCELIGIPVYQVYGLTETTGIVTMDKPGEAVAGRV
ncbi:MAG: long-chain acyl-CoA synthetase, partial [Myxococcota bacterium]